MLVATILQGKGREVHTVRPDDTIATAVGSLSEFGIGALVVSTDGRRVDGIISERDIVRGLSEKGENLLGEPVSSVMTVEVLTCGLDDTGRGVLGYMTERRVRHVPVLENGELCGMISIGDVVKSRLDEIMNEADALREYISHT